MSEVSGPVLDGTTGLLAPADDVEALADAIARLSLDAGLRQQMAVAGRAHAQSSFTLSRLAADHAELYRSLLASRLPS